MEDIRSIGGIRRGNSMIYIVLVYVMYNNVELACY